METKYKTEKIFFQSIKQKACYSQPGVFYINKHTNQYSNKYKYSQKPTLQTIFSQYFISQFSS